MGKQRAEYRCVATSVEGFVQQVSVQYLRHGYWFYVAGQIPEDKDPTTVDAKLIKKYGVDVSRWERARRKRAGQANMQYIRHERFFLLMATHGNHRFFGDEAEQTRDARRVPIKYAGYSISFRRGHTSVRIENGEYRRLRGHLLEAATTCDRLGLMAAFGVPRFQPYKPVRRQMLAIWRAANAVRRENRQEPVPVECVPWRRSPMTPFRRS